MQGKIPPGAPGAIIHIDNTQMGGDPIPGVGKTLRVTYSLNGGAPFRVEGIEGQDLRLGQ